MPDLFLLHFDPPYRHAGHYLGYAKGTGRVATYARAVAAGKVTQFPHPLVEAAYAQGSVLRIVAVFHGASRDERRRMRANGSLSRFCPVCRENGRHHP